MLYFVVFGCVAVLVYCFADIEFIADIKETSLDSFILWGGEASIFLVGVHRVKHYDNLYI